MDKQKNFHQVTNNNSGDRNKKIFNLYSQEVHKDIRVINSEQKKKRKKKLFLKIYNVEAAFKGKKCIMWLPKCKKYEKDWNNRIDMAMTKTKTLET